MAYTPPARGQLNWDTDLNASLDALHTASSDAGVAGYVNDTASSTRAALSAAYVPRTGGSAGRITGDLYFANSGTVYSRKADNSGEIQVLGTTNGNGIVLGGANGSDVFVYTSGLGDIVLDPDTYGSGVVSVYSKMSVGAAIGGAPAEALHVVGNGYLATGTLNTYLQIVTVGTGAKSWRVGVGGVTAGRFEIQDTSDSATPYLSIDPSGNVRIGTLYSTGSLNTTQLLVGTGTDNSGTQFLINSSGQPRWVNSANITTTVGAAGAAAAPPATPAKYLTVLDAAGNPFKIPAYNP